MNRIKKILCGSLALFLLGTAGVLWWQRDNLKALKQAAQHSSAELEQQMQENQQAMQDAVNAAPEVVIRDVTEEEREALKDGTLTQEELIDRLTKPEEPVQSAAPPSPENSETVTPPAEEAPAVDPEYQAKLSALVAEVYVLREQYTIQLDNMYAAAKAEYIKMPKSQRTTEKLSKWAMEYVKQANKLEKTCDTAILDVSKRMEELIRANNGDLSLVDTMVYTYASEKSLKKAFYMSKLEEKGLI